VIEVHPGDRLASALDLDPPYGSVGIPVQDENGAEVILTAAHVLRGKGTDWFCGTRTNADIELHSILCARTTRLHPMINPLSNASWDHGVDAGFLRATGVHGASFTRSIPEAGQEPMVGAGWVLPPVITSTVAPASVGMTVWKRGASTGITVGTIELLVTDPIDPAMSSVHWWSAPHVEVAPLPPFEHFSDGGDSGAIVCDIHGNPVAFHVGGSTRRRKSYDVLIAEVLTRLRVSL
jgi:hypothetical protein